MVELVIEQELHRHLSELPVPQQQQVLDFARALFDGEASVLGQTGWEKRTVSSGPLSESPR